MDLSRKVIIDLWDEDVVAPDFMGYLEISLQGLVDAAGGKTALEVKPPPSKKAAEAGRLYVECATIGFPQVTATFQPCS